MSNLVTKAEFARLIGRDRSWVTRMAQAHRLVIEGQGKAARIKVAESKALLEQTAGTRDDVAARHADERRGRPRKDRQPDFAFGSAAVIEPAPVPQPKPAPESPPAAVPESVASAEATEMAEARRAKLLAESRRVQAAADREEMERDKLAGDLIAREDVDAAMKFIGAGVRGLLEVFPDQVAPIVAPIGNLDDCHAALTEACRNTLVQLGELVERQQAALAKDPA